jgi:hypothetical protein
MTATAELLTDLQALGVILAADGDRLRFHPKDKVTPELLARMRDAKGELLAMLRTVNGVYVYETDTTTADTSVVSQAVRYDAHGAAPAPRPRSAVPVVVEWPGAAADFCLLLTPGDLPPVPFALNGWTTITDTAKFLRWLRGDIAAGPSGPRAFYGALQTDLLALQRFVLQAAGNEPQDYPRTNADGATCPKVSRGGPVRQNAS